MLTEKQQQSQQQIVNIHFYSGTKPLNIRHRILSPRFTSSTQLCSQFYSDKFNMVDFPVSQFYDKIHMLRCKIHRHTVLHILLYTLTLGWRMWRTGGVNKKKRSGNFNQFIQLITAGKKENTTGRYTESEGDCEWVARLPSPLDTRSQSGRWVRVGR